MAEASASVLFRGEKTLLRAHLAWLDRSGWRSPDRAAAAVRGAALALGNSVSGAGSTWAGRLQSAGTAA
ncbi:hypothetical protein [Streptacidiphilus rugosus]|uniref:hypothetical protein n=1 Tax=Streptacidiphilus rugosus TaxID=405783 RepID=UPI000569C007|nr:hypothetical protein [Streptacidiphilus rugosus]